MSWNLSITISEVSAVEQLSFSRNEDVDAYYFNVSWIPIMTIPGAIWMLNSDSYDLDPAVNQIMRGFPAIAEKNGSFIYRMPENWQPGEFSVILLTSDLLTKWRSNSLTIGRSEATYSFWPFVPPLIYTLLTGSEGTLEIGTSVSAEIAGGKSPYLMKLMLEEAGSNSSMLLCTLNRPGACNFTVPDVSGRKAKDGYFLAVTDGWHFYSRHFAVRNSSVSGLIASSSQIDGPFVSALSTGLERNSPTLVSSLDQSLSLLTFSSAVISSQIQTSINPFSVATFPKTSQRRTPFPPLLNLSATPSRTATKKSLPTASDVRTTLSQRLTPSSAHVVLNPILGLSQPVQAGYTKGFVTGLFKATVAKPTTISVPEALNSSVLPASSIQSESVKLVADQSAESSLASLVSSSGLQSTLGFTHLFNTSQFFSTGTVSQSSLTSIDLNYKLSGPLNLTPNSRAPKTTYKSPIRTNNFFKTVFVMSIPLPTSTSFPKPGMPATPTTALATSYSSSPTTIIQIVQTDTTASFLTILLFLALLCLVLFQLLKNNPFNQASVDQSQARPQITQPTEAAALSAIELPAEPAEVSGIPSSQSIVCEITNGIQRGRIQFEMGSATSMGSRSRSMTESDHQDMATETWVHDLRPSEKIQERSKDGDVTVTINERRTSLVFD